MGQVWCGVHQLVHKCCCCNVGLGLSVCRQGWLRSGQKVSGSSCVGLVCNAAEWERVRGNAPQGLDWTCVALRGRWRGGEPLAHSSPD